MTLSEFKAWFEGYTEGLEAAPTKAQFDRIKEKVKEIDGTPVTPIYIDRYWPVWQPTPAYPWRQDWYSTTNVAQTNIGDFVVAGVDAAFDGHAAMYALGRADAAN